MDKSAMRCTSFRTRTRQLRTPIRKPSNREQHERLRSHVSTISLDADAYQKAPAPSAVRRTSLRSILNFPIEGRHPRHPRSLARRYFADPSTAAGSRP
jgi:hypothetical protein